MKLNDKNRDKIPEKVRQEQDAQWEKFCEEEKVILASIEKIKQIKWVKSNSGKINVLNIANWLICDLLGLTDGLVFIEFGINYLRV